MALEQIETQHSNDILIAETAIRNSLAVVSGAADLAQVVRAFKGESLTLEEFLTNLAELPAGNCGAIV
jgi:hypothetical protein